MDVSKRIQSLIDTGEYTTENQQKRSLFAGIKGLREIGFYLGYGFIVLQSSFLARLKSWDDDAWSLQGWRIIRLCEKYGLTFKIEGLKNIEKLGGGHVFVANHMSTLETQVLACLLNPFTRCCYVAKEILFKAPIFGVIMKASHGISMGRKNPFKDLSLLFEEGANRIQNKRSIILFPQGRRQRVLRSEDFRTIGVRLAEKVDCHCIPVAVKTDAWGLGRIISDISWLSPEKEVHIAFGTPVSNSLSVKERNKVCFQYIEEKLESWNIEK